MANATHTIEENAVDAVLADDLSIEELEAELSGESETEEVELSEEELTETERALELDESRSKAYEEQDSTTDPEPDAEDVKAKTNTKKVKPRVSTSGLKPQAALRARYGKKVYELVTINDSDAALSDEKLESQVDQYLNHFDTLAKKVGEKVNNFFMHINGDATLSVYSKIAIDLLKESGEMTTADLRKAYQSDPYNYKVGTANAQSSQMMTLLPELGLADRDGTKLTLSESSPLLDLLS